MTIGINRHGGGKGEILKGRPGAIVKDRLNPGGLTIEKLCNTLVLLIERRANAQKTGEINKYQTYQ